MSEHYLKYINITLDKNNKEYCSGDSLSYIFIIHKSKIINYNSQITNIYYHLKKSLNLILKNIETVNFSEVLSESDFSSFTFENNGTVIFEYDIELFWFDYLSKTFSTIHLPRGCNIMISKNDKLDHPVFIVLSFDFNLFSNNLISVKTYGKYEKELYYFKPAARINRAIVRNAVIELKLKHPEVEIEFNNEIGWLSHFDEFGFTEETDFVFD